MTEKIITILDLKIRDANFSARTENCLRRINILTINDLIKWTSSELMKERNFGKRSLFEIRLFLNERGLCLADETKMKERISKIPYSLANVKMQIEEIENLAWNLKKHFIELEKELVDIQKIQEFLSQEKTQEDEAKERD